MDTSPINRRPVCTWLYIEDNPGDIGLVRAAVDEVAPSVRVLSVETGEAAVQFLSQTGPCDQVPTPDLIVLDYGLPDMDAGELLSMVNNSAQFSHIPVILFSSRSADDPGLRELLDNPNTCFVAKPIALEELYEAISRIAERCPCEAEVPAKRTEQPATV